MADVEKLMQAGFDYLDDREYGKALKTGKKLRRMKHSSAFEIMALAYEGKGNLNRTIKVLESGTELVPSVWVLWQLLGNLYSDTSRWKRS